MHCPRLFLSICACSFFGMIGAVRIIIFPPLGKNILTADERVASLVIPIFSVGIATGSIVINTMLRGRISAQFAPASAIALRGFVVLFSLLLRLWTPAPEGHFSAGLAFIADTHAPLTARSPLRLAVHGGRFAVGA